MGILGGGERLVVSKQSMAILEEGLWQHMEKSSVPKDDMVL